MPNIQSLTYFLPELILTGFVMVIILTEPAEPGKELPTAENKPDLIIHDFGELLGIFPARRIN